MSSSGYIRSDLPLRGMGQKGYFFLTDGLLRAAAPFRYLRCPPSGHFVPGQPRAGGGVQVSPSSPGSITARSFLAVDVCLAKPLEHGRRLAAAGVALGPEGAVVVAAHDARRVSPAEGGDGVAADALCVGKGRKVGQLRHVPALVICVAVEHGGHLLPGDGIVGAKTAVGITAYHAHAGRPADAFGVPGAIGHIGEVRVRINGWAALQPPEDHGDHGPAGGDVWAEGGVACADHQVVGKHKHNVLIKPIALRNVGKGVFKARTRIILDFFPPGVNRGIVG